MTDPLLLNLPSFIETDRLLMRVPEAGDGARLHEAIIESLEELRRCLLSIPWAGGEQTPESAELYCRASQSNFIARRDLHFLLFAKDSGELVGVSNLHNMDWAVPKMEIGYWVRTSMSGNGFITEAASALTTYAFNHAHAARVEIVVEENNIASRRVAERCGFVLEGIHRHNRRSPEGRLKSSCIYARCWLRHSGGYETMATALEPETA